MSRLVDLSESWAREDITIGQRPDANFRSQGIGGMLIDRLIDEARSRGVDRAMVYSATRDIDQVISFYRSHGFQSWFVQLYR